MQIDFILPPGLCTKGDLFLIVYLLSLFCYDFVYEKLPLLQYLGDFQTNY